MLRSGLADGTHTFAVRAIDLEGDVDPTPASATWTIQAAASPMNPSPPSTILPFPARPPVITAAAVMPKLRGLLARIVGELGPRALQRIAAGRTVAVRGVHIPFSGVLTVSLDVKATTAATGLAVTGTRLHSTLRIGATRSGLCLLRRHLSRITVAAALELAGGETLHAAEVVHLPA